MSSNSPVEHALSLLVSGDPEAALRFSAAALEADPSSPAALIVTSRALWRIGDTQAAVDGFHAAARSAARSGDVPLAIAAIADVRSAGGDAEGLVDEIARVVGKRTAEGAPIEPSRRGAVQPIGPLLTKRALVSRAEQMIHEAAGTGYGRKSAVTLFDAPSESAFRDLALAFETLTVPPGYRATEEGVETRDLYVVASGQVQIERRGESGACLLARAENGAVLGELAVLAPLPAPSSAVTTCATILLVASRAAMAEIAARNPELGAELEAHCRGQAILNLGSACSCMSAMPSRDRAALVERMTSRLFVRGERLVHTGDYAEGLHVVLSGEVALVAHEGGERVVMSTLTPGQVVGEAELVLCQTAVTEAVAACSTATLFLPREHFFALALDNPAILHGLYAAAVRRHGETEEALSARAAAVVESDVTIDDAPAAELPPRPSGGELPGVERATPVAALPHATQPSAVPHDATQPSARPRATPASSAPSSLAPFAASASLRPPPRRFSIVRRSAQGAAVVAVAAGVAAVLASGEERPSALVSPQTRSFGSGGASPPSTYSPTATSAAVEAPSPPSAPAQPPAVATFGPPAPSATPARTSSKFLMSSLQKRPREAVSTDPSPDDDDHVSAAPPSARTVPPPSTPPAPPRAAPAVGAENDFGGRE
jgi:CRP-like cAMP-binding protein